MPRSISSLHSRTATNSSSQHSSGPSSIKTPSARSHGSTTGSLSTISSEPFIHADALDTTIQWIPSYYLDDSSQHDSTIRAPRRNALVHTPSSSIFSSKVNLLPHGLMQLIRTSKLEQSLKDMLLAMVRMIVHTSHQLFPSSHILRGDVARDVETISQDICDFLDLILEKLEQRLDAASSATDQLSAHHMPGEVALEEVTRWIDIIEYAPTHDEAKIFRRMATLYDEFVYMPFIQLHRQEPEHNMYLLLDTFLDAIFIRLRAIIAAATSADTLVHEVEKTLDAAATAHANKVTKRHIPSQSMPVAYNPRLFALRQRENTL
ncbi:unnamed protein product [Aureobasidium uvarum]|uniref:Uncharacterized protein n=1 Tax=Aureobasidium uvarum TaxID=2773716 RepID=A0A9N8KK07_9PEZI|nr:unnamed protein product [Aureobasidium uvarum]